MKLKSIDLRCLDEVRGGVGPATGMADDPPTGSPARRAWAREADFQDNVYRAGFPSEYMNNTDSRVESRFHEMRYQGTPIIPRGF